MSLFDFYAVPSCKFADGMINLIWIRAMPKILVEVNDSVETVLRPVVLDITRTLFKKTAIPDDITILFPGDIDRQQQPGASISTQFKNNVDPVKFPFASQMGIEVVEDYFPDTMLQNAVMRPENNFLFRDDGIGSYIRPVYSQQHDVTINYTYRAKDKTEAIRWRDGIKNHTAMNRQQFVHDIKYSYLIPEETTIILKELHRLRENVAGFGEDFETFFQRYRTQRIHMMTNLAGANARWAVTESQLRVQGWFDFAGVPEVGSKQDEGDTWTITFSYHFQYDKPLAVIMGYPLVVHNQLIPQWIRPDESEQPPYEIEKQRRTYGLSAKMFSFFESTNRVYRENQLRGYAIPAFDEFLPNQVLPTSIRIFTAMVTLDLEDPSKRRFLFNLVTDVVKAKLQFYDDMVCCLDSEWPFMCQFFKSVFNLTLYRGKSLMNENYLTIDEHFNVWSTVDLDPRHYYHVRFGLYRDLNQIPPDALARLQSCPDCLLKILDTIDPTLKTRGLLPTPVDGSWIPTGPLKTAIGSINTGNAPGQGQPKPGSPRGNGQTYQFNTVGTLLISSYRDTTNQKGA